MNTKRKRVEDSDDDDELWNEAALIDEAIIRTQASQMPQTQASQMFKQDSPIKLDISLNTQRDQVTELQTKIDQVMGELVKKSREKTELMKEINKLKTKNHVTQMATAQCSNACKKQLEALTTDLRFKERELISYREKIRDLSQRKPTESAKPEASRDPPKQIPLVFPTLHLIPHQDLDTLEEFSKSETSSEFSQRQFLKWCNHRGDLAEQENYVDRLSTIAPKTYQKLKDHACDDDLTAAFLGFLAHIQMSVEKGIFSEVIDWQLCLPNAHNNMNLLLSLVKFLRYSDPQTLFPAIKSFISVETNWRHPKFEFLLNSVMTLIASKPLTHESEIVAKTVLRIYRHSLHSESDSTQMDLLLTASLRLLFMEANLEGELVSVVTRAEAFHHLGDVLKKFIRWQPMVSLTGCPEMMEIAENSFRNTGW